MTRYRITTEAPGGPEQTWVLLPDEPSAVIQAEEFAQREAGLHIRVYREVTGRSRELIRDLPARQG